MSLFRVLFIICCTYFVTFVSLTRYRERIKDALESNKIRPSVLSMIVDGMDQNHCHVPHTGSQNSFSKPLKSMLVGVYEHGFGLSLYRTFNTVSKSADLTMQCILLQIEAYYKRHLVYPEEIYLQVDGGCENANQYLLGLLELLVAKRLCKRIYYTRLPTGHTHEDIDALFAVIWKALRGKNCETLEQHRDILIKAFKSQNITCQLTDIYVVPNYKPFLSAVLDPNLGRLHKGITTQHQWRFECVEPSVHFPLGCKTMYRLYSSDKVVEFRKLPKMQCMSEIGKYTGLEPTTVFVRWQPSEDANLPGREGIAGFYLLHRFPHFDVTAAGRFPAKPLAGDCSASMQGTVAEVCSTFHVVNDQKTRAAWSAWAEIYIPHSDDEDVEAYIDRLLDLGINIYKVPLQALLLNQEKILDSNRWEAVGGRLPTFDAGNSDFTWPDIIAVSTNSVEHSLNPNPQDPRLYITNNEAFVLIMSQYRGATEVHYGETGLRRVSNPILKKLLLAKVQYDGQKPSTSGKTSQLLVNTTLTDHYAVLFRQ